MFTYLFINLATISVPLMFSLDKRLNFYRQWRFVLPAIALTAVFFWIWDAIFTEMGIWWFNDRYLIGLRLAGLPVEELLFFITVPYACLFIYVTLKQYFPVRASSIWRLAYLVIGFFMLALGLTHLSQTYTAVVSLLLGAVCLVVVFLNVKYLGQFALMFMISLVPFIAVNGILTNGLPFVDLLPVVNYSEQYILGIRVMGIPVEDAIYSMLLLLMNVGWYEWLRGRVK